MKVTTQFCVERGEEEVELTLVGQFSPGDPGKVSGPPENCWPPEPAEAEVEQVLKDGKPWDGKLTEEEEDAAVEALLKAGDDSFDDGPDPDDFYDSRFDRDDDFDPFDD